MKLMLQTCPLCRQSLMVTDGYRPDGVYIPLVSMLEHYQESHADS